MPSSKKIDNEAVQPEEIEFSSDAQSTADGLDVEMERRYGFEADFQPTL
jgi:hypothetical protein